MHPTSNIVELTMLRLIPLIPLLGATLNVFFGTRLGRKHAALLACFAVAVAFLLSIYAAFILPADGMLRDTLFTWIHSDPLHVSVAFQVDVLTIVMLLVITGIGLLIHVYSIGYMGHDEGLIRYFIYLNLFIFFMGVLVMADNLLVLFVGWEGVGLCSFLLIGFWYQDNANTIAGNKAFIVNRMGDFGFVLGMLLLFWEMGRHGVWTFDVSVLQRNVHLLSPTAATVITLLLFAGATGKSAQIPLYVWLPDAMQGPTPVSALIHAATMVTAGVYMTARLFFLFELAPITLAVIATVGALTAFFAATIALVQNDVKRVLAYSTVSQLGYMFVAVGVGAFSAAIFHLFTHAFFKACLFLGAGSVIHGLEGEQDMRKMGGLKPYFPWTYWTYLIAALALSGVPLTAGFFSKDQILWLALVSPQGSLWYWLLGWLTAGLTGFYMFRQLFMIFHGRNNIGESLKDRIHESPKWMTLPLVFLAVGSIFSGWVATPDFLWGGPWERWFGPFFGTHDGTSHGKVENELFFMSLTVGVIAVGIYIAYHLYGNEMRGREPRPQGMIHQLLVNKYYVDELYDFLLVRPLTRFALWLAEIFDPRVVDGSVNRVADAVRRQGLALRHIQSGYVQHYLFGFLAGSLLVLGYYVLS